MSNAINLTMEPYAKQLAVKVDGIVANTNSTLDNIKLKLDSTNSYLGQTGTMLINQLNSYQGSLNAALSTSQGNVVTQINATNTTVDNTIAETNSLLNTQSMQTQTTLQNLTNSQSALLTQNNANSTEIQTLINQNQSSINQAVVEATTNIGNLISQNYNNIVKNTNNIQYYSNRVSAISVTNSPNTLANPALMDRYPLQSGDVIKFLNQSADQKAQGQAYAGKYSLTPQNFYINTFGTLRKTPYNNSPPPTDGVTTWGLGNLQSNPTPGYDVPIITDACYQLYDSSTGIHYRWDQFQASSQRFKGLHWFLDGPIVSTSLDGLKWVCTRAQLYSSDGAAARTGFWFDRDNRLGNGYGKLYISDPYNLYFMPNFNSGGGIKVGGGPVPYGDHRIYWDSVVFNNFVVLSVDSQNTKLLVSTGSNLSNITLAYEINDPTFTNNRIECPSWLRMKDTVTGNITTVLTAAVQANGAGSPTWAHTETFEMCVINYTTTGYTITTPFRQIEYGKHAYAHMLCDPLQQDGTGSTNNYCTSAVMNVGCFAWSYLNGGNALPSYGFSGGGWIPADTVLTNGIPMCLPNSKFKAAMTGQTYSVVGLANGNGTSTTMNITSNSNVWRAELDINQIDTSSNNSYSIQFNFGSCYVTYPIVNGIIDYVPNNSGNTVIYPNNQGGPNDKTTRWMPLIQSFVTVSGLTLVWEYDNGRIRMYNVTTGEYMSELIFPNGNCLTSVSFTGTGPMVSQGYVLTVNQDGGDIY